MLYPYNRKDFTDCVALFTAAFSAPPINFAFITNEKARRYLGDIAQLPNFCAFVYGTPETLDAFCFGTIDDYFHSPQYVIKEFAVNPTLHGKGIGSQFLREIETRLTEKGVTAISLQTSRTIPAFSFYKKNGFFESKETVTLMKLLI